MERVPFVYLPAAGCIHLGAGIRLCWLPAAAAIYLRVPPTPSDSISLPSAR